jgi:DNA-binding MarR family transcriptional regulator
MARKGIPGLSDEEADAWMPLIGVTVWLPAALDMQLARDEGISHFEYGVLSALARQEGRSMRLKELSRLANSTLPRMSKTMDRLEKQGWVERRADPDDGRATLGVLTADGLRKVAAATPAHVQFARELVLDNLTPSQVRQLTVIATKILRAAGPDGACASRMS